MSDLLEAMATAGEEDLTKVRGRIEQLTKELEGLRQVEKILDRRLHGKPQRAATATAAAGGTAGGTLADQIAKTIREDGPATVDDLATALEVKQQAIRMALQRGAFRFQRIGNRYGLSERESPRGMNVER